MSETLTATPQWTTPVKDVLDGGRILGVDSSMWAYRAVPLSPIQDAKNAQYINEAAYPLLRLSEQLAPLASTTGKRRKVNESSYRELHLLLVNIPTPFEPIHGLPNAAMLKADYRGQYTFRRLFLVGVRLIPKMTRKNKNKLSAVAESVTDTLRNGGTPVEDYDEDYQLVDTIMRDAGLRELGTDDFGRDELALAMAWWNFGDSTDAPVLLHNDHVHVCRTISAAQKVKSMDSEECANWRLPGEAYALTLTSVADLDLPWIDGVTSRAQWAIDLLQSGARAVSIRTKVEPPSITRAELARGRDRYRKDREDRVAQGLLSKADQDQQIELLSQVESVYGTEGGEPTFEDTSIVVALDGVKKDVERLMGDGPVKLGALPGRQQAAFMEMMLCSSVHAAPQVLDLPAQTVAYAGLANLSTVGDKDGALLGLTEADLQPAYMSPFAATRGDSGPLMLLAGGTGSGKTAALMNLVRQWSQIPTTRGWRTPIVMIDPKSGSDFSEPVRKLGGQVMSLDDLASADGVFDPIRTLVDRTSPQTIAKTTGEAVDLASQMLSSIDPWGGDLRGRFEVDLLSALRYGVENGGTCVGEALRIADAAHPLPEGLLPPIMKMLEATPLARAILGFSPTTQALRQNEGLSLIMVGNARITLPDSGEGAWERSVIVQRIGSWVLRMMVYGSAASVAYREGVVVLDEAWQFMIGPEGRAELDRLSRLARSQQVLVVLASQKVSDFVSADLLGGISRGLILPLDRGTGQRLPNGTVDNGEAGLALSLFKIEQTEQRLARLAAPAQLPGSDAPNWSSMRALRDPDTREVLRGTIGLYVDLTGRVVPTQIVIPRSFLAEISTTSTDVIERQRRRAAEADGRVPEDSR